MPLTEDELQTPRTPQDLRDYVLLRIKAAKSIRAEGESALLKSGLYKQLRDEILYLALCAHKLYPSNFRIQPILGKQGYDAKVFTESGKCVDYIEIANPHNGAADAQDAKLAVRNGTASRIVAEEAFGTLRRILVETCRKKSQKDYADCTLIIVADWAELVMYEADELHIIMMDLCQETSHFQFHAKRVYIYEARADYLYAVVGA